MMFSKYWLYCLQDIRLKKKLFWLVACSILTLQLLMVLPIMSRATTWHTLKGFISASVYEFSYLPLFLILLALFPSKDNDWLLLRRYAHRQQIATYKIYFVLLVTSFFTAIVWLGSMLSTSIAKWLFFPYVANYSAILLYVPEYKAEPDEIGSLLYFSYMFFCVTAIFGLLYIVFQQLVKNNFLSVVFVWVLGIADRYGFHMVSIFFYESEFTSPISTFLMLVAIMILLINAIHYLVNKLDFYVRDDTT